MGFEENGLVGLNPELARKNIDEFVEKGHECATEMQKCFSYLFDELSSVWASEHAVDFWTNQNSQIGEMISSFIYDVDIAAQNAAHAFNTVANANGASGIGKTYYEAGMGVAAIEFTELKSDINGAKGMNIALVRDFILPTFNNKLANVYSLIDLMPTSIALFDSENSQADAFATSVSNVKLQVQRRVDEVLRDIEAKMQIEIDALYLAKQQSTDAMNNMNA